jgi:hypothetical protein
MEHVLRALRKLTVSNALSMTQTEPFALRQTNETRGAEERSEEIEVTTMKQMMQLGKAVQGTRSRVLFPSDAENTLVVW